MQFISSLLLFLAPLTLALPVSDAAIKDVAVDAALDARACYVTCGSTCYTSAQVSAARTAGYNHQKAGTVAGSSTYPHKYNNYEGFSFLAGGTYYEFPLKTGGVYTGGSPGADRVVFNGSGARAGEITHTGASGNNFVKCAGW
ncbi:ribonuclease-domain-containing protein [Dothidotthia symphoricarpi CBS 119687]|uniref:ribonuclease T1 n=1 Tax=Dothidotthia symphoricarpi CBS 119687 TaxID=1392245 RepID=A0A6A6A6Y6_9PLEO|nr:ribonuclease-domain-containing protein [Dothidotthia symphoricarpi CBS 119687]KAF2126391.1 ribonuclease-domain-containing protein [Dothidotthia symphoricarpi CBS 119687]